jgi:hypothetical protein
MLGHGVSCPGWAVHSAVDILGQPVAPRPRSALGPRSLSPSHVAFRVRRRRVWQRHAWKRRARAAGAGRRPSLPQRCCGARRAAAAHAAMRCRAQARTCAHPPRTRAPEEQLAAGRPWGAAAGRHHSWSCMAGTAPAPAGAARPAAKPPQPSGAVRPARALGHAQGLMMLCWAAPAVLVLLPPRAHCGGCHCTACSPWGRPQGRLREAPGRPKANCACLLSTAPPGSRPAPRRLLCAHC